jgi:hypothetical protein
MVRTVGYAASRRRVTEGNLSEPDRRGRQMGDRLQRTKGKAEDKGEVKKNVGSIPSSTAVGEKVMRAARIAVPTATWC